MLDFTTLINLPAIHSKLPMCYSICIERQKTYGELFIEYAKSLKIEGYCRGCMGQNNKRDCSSIISKYLIDNGILKKRINSYVLANYGIRLHKDQAKPGDLAVMINKGSGSHHTAIYYGFDNRGMLIMDLVELKTKRSIRPFNNNKDYNIYIIGNPIRYGFKKSFYNTYTNYITN